MPRSIQSDIPMDAVGEALLKHYNVGIRNPWFEIGVSDQETYNRRKLPWAGKNYSVSADGNVSGPNVDQLHPNLVQKWISLANASRDFLDGTEGDWDGLEDMYDNVLTDDLGDSLRPGGQYHESPD